MIDENLLRKRIEEEVEKFSSTVNNDPVLIEAYKEGIYEGLKKWLEEHDVNK